MDRQLHVKNIQDLTDQEARRCRELTYGPEGWMQEEFDRWREDWWRTGGREARVIMITEGDRIIGWSLLQPIRGVAKYTAYFFVDPEYRKQGVGKMLLHCARNQSRFKPQVVKDETNSYFFERYPQLWTSKNEDLKVQ